jgi:hypothetical protein
MPEQARRKFAVRVVGARGYEHVVAGLQKCQINEGDRGLSAGREKGVRAGFEFANTGCEFEHRGGAVKAVGVADALLIPGIVDGGCRGEQRGGAAEGGSREGAVAFGDFGVGVNQFRFPGFAHALELPGPDERRNYSQFRGDSRARGVRGVPGAGGKMRFSRERAKSKKSFERTHARSMGLH